MIDTKNIEAILKEAGADAINAISDGRSGVNFSLAPPGAAAVCEKKGASIKLEVETPVNLKFSMKATRSLLISIAAIALEMREDEIGEDEYMDTGAEILNIAAGTCVKKILTENLALKLGLPQKNSSWEGLNHILLCECNFLKGEDDYIIFSVYAP